MPWCTIVGKPDWLGKRLRVAIFDASRSGEPHHPAATTCAEALASTPWFYSKAVALLCGAVKKESDSSAHRADESPFAPVDVVLMRGSDVRAGALGAGASTFFDVVLVPGGSAGADARLMGDLGRKAVQDFVMSGGGYCGICAGAFLALPGKRQSAPDSFALVDAPRTKQSSNALVASELCHVLSDEENIGSTANKPTVAAQQVSRDRAPLLVEVHWSRLGRRLLWDEGRSRNSEVEEAKDGSVLMRYHNGPLLFAPLKAAQRYPDKTESYDTNGCKNGADNTDSVGYGGAAAAARLPQLRSLGKMRQATRSPAGDAISGASTTPCAFCGAAAVCMAEVARGRVVLISPHPESTQHQGLGHSPGKLRLRRVLQRAVLLAAVGPYSGREWLQDLVHLPA